MNGLRKQLSQRLKKLVFERDILDSDIQSIETVIRSLEPEAPTKKVKQKKTRRGWSAALRARHSALLREKFQLRRDQKSAEQQAQETAGVPA